MNKREIYKAYEHKKVPKFTELMRSLFLIHYSVIKYYSTMIYF